MPREALEVAELTHSFAAERTKVEGEGSRPMNASTPLMLENTIQSNVPARAQAASSASKHRADAIIGASIARRPSPSRSTSSAD